MPFWWIVVLVVVLDQGAKWLTKTTMVLGESIPVIPSVFHITYIENPGAAFGMLKYKTLFFILITLLVLATIIYFYYAHGRHNPWFTLGLALQCGGAVGNLIDRLHTGLVVDFLDVRFFSIFNLADIAITFGVIILAWQIIKNPQGEEETTGAN